MGRLAGKAQETGQGCLHVVASPLIRASFDLKSSPDSQKETSFHKKISFIHVTFSLKRATFTVFWIFPVSAAPQNNQLRIVLVPKGHILEGHVLYPSWFNAFILKTVKSWPVTLCVHKLQCLAPPGPSSASFFPRELITLICKSKCFFLIVPARRSDGYGLDSSYHLLPHWRWELRLVQPPTHTHCTVGALLCIAASWTLPDTWQGLLFTLMVPTTLSCIVITFYCKKSVS